jgi:hypothetical protein
MIGMEKLRTRHRRGSRFMTTAARNLINNKAMLTLAKGCGKQKVA